MKMAVTTDDKKKPAAHRHKLAKARSSTTAKPQNQSCIYIDIIIARRVEALANLLQSLMHRRRFETCMAVLQSSTLCQQNGAGFYIWANRLAKDIMNGSRKKYQTDGEFK